MFFCEDQVDIQSSRKSRPYLSRKSISRYGRVEPGFFGTQSLIQKLMKILGLQIKAFLPKIKRDVFEMRQKIELRLQELGDGIPSDEATKTQLVWRDIAR